jgi:hypothetical protein
MWILYSLNANLTQSQSVLVYIVCRNWCLNSISEFYDLAGITTQTEASERNSPELIEKFSDVI